MKKAFFYIVMGFIMMSCGGGHHEYSVKVDDNTPVTNFQYNTDKKIIYSDDNDLSQVFTIVPGVYTLTSDKHSKGTMTASEVNLTLKLKLLKPVKIKKQDNIHYTWFGVNLLDANDKVLEQKEGMSIGGLTLGAYKFDPESDYLYKDKNIEKDALEEFIEFLGSPAGTEVEFTFGGQTGLDDDKFLENVVGLEIYLDSYLAWPKGKIGDRHGNLEWKE